MFAIVPRETFCCQLLLFSCSAGLFAVLLASLPFCWSMPVCWLFCRSAGFSAALLASLPLCWRAAGALVYRATAGCLSLCLLTPGVFLLVVTLLPAADLCRLHLPCLPVFSVAQSSVFVVHVDILMFVIV
ncbi:hypothetical protein [Thiolapillus sp.]|uniref:hypothetical protein n=1 Tax=Thiolapillus sp. TaxID=2017437 RepID=UPI003AF42E78